MGSNEYGNIYLEASTFTVKSFDAFNITIIDLLIQQFVFGLLLPHWINSIFRVTERERKKGNRKVSPRKFRRREI